MHIRLAHLQFFPLCLLLLLSHSTAQTTDWTADLTATNATGNTIQLQFGQSGQASSAVDRSLGEQELPPLPPLTIMDVRFQVAGTNGIARDLRDMNNQEMTWTIQIQAGSGGFPVRFAWNPASLSAGLFLLQDVITNGDLINIDMGQEGEFVVDNAALNLIQIRFVASTIPTAVEPRQAEPPTTFVLQQNYPNPFNGSTLIPFTIPPGEAGMGELALYNLAGQKIAILAQGHFSSGRHTATWDGQTDAGQNAAAGLYLYRLITPKATAVRTLMYLQ